MIVEEMRTTAVKPKTRIEKITDEALAAARDATRTIEVEAAAMRALEDAYKKANDTATELKSAIAASKAANLLIKKARNYVKQAQIEAKKMEKIKALADKDETQKEVTRKDEEEKAILAEKRGRQFSRTSIDKARRKSEESEQKAVIAQRYTERTGAVLAAAVREVKAAEEEAVRASMRIKAAREAEASARMAVPRAEDVARRAVKVTKIALEVESSAKKTMDITIKSLKSFMAREAKTTQAAESAMVRTGLQEAQKIEERVMKEVKGIDGEMNRTRQFPDLYSGTVKLMIVGHTDHIMLKKFQERLEQINDFQVKLVSSSIDEGTVIKIQAEKSVPLIGRLNELELVDSVSRISRKEIEVALKPVC